MIITNRSEPVSRHKSTDGSRDIRNDESKNGAGSTPRNLVEPTVLLQFSGIRVVPEGFFKDIRKLTFAVGGSVVGIRCGSRMTLSGFIVFPSLLSLKGLAEIDEVLFGHRIERSALR